VSKLSKILYLCVILLLAGLAILPYWPKIKEEATNFYTAWQQIRKQEDSNTDKAPAREAEDKATRTRILAPPKAPAELPETADRKATGETIDPFLREARKRAKEDPEAAMQWLREQSKGTQRLRGMLEVVALWAAKDSESALLWLESNAQGLARLETLNSGVELWAQRDPKAAAGWIDGMANDQSKISAAKSLASTWVRTNPEAASAWLDALSDGPVREEAAGALVLSWMETDPARAIVWAGQEARATGNRQLFSQAVGQYAQVAPQEAETFLRMNPIQDLQARDSYIEAFVEARAKSDPVETAEWLQSLPNGDPFYDPNHASRLMEVWAETDSVAASAWLSEQALGPERDAAIAGFSKSIRRFEPEAAAAWADSISDPEQRVRELTKSVQTWARSNPDEALNWLINAELEPALQEQLAREIGAE